MRLRWLAFLLPLCGHAAVAHFFHLSIEQGLSQNSVQAIWQDQTGYMWFGTEEGLNRYDGYGFVVYRHVASDPNSLPDDQITALFEDSRHRFWIGTHHGLCQFHPDSGAFTPIENVKDRVDCIREAPDGTVWMASEGGGLFVLAPGSTRFASYVPLRNSPNDSISSFTLSTVYIDRRGRLWIGTHDHGLDQFVPSGDFGTFIHHRHDPLDPHSLGSDDVWGLSEDADGNLLVATYDGGLEMRDEATGQFRVVARSAKGFKLTSVLTDRSGQVWVGMDGGGIARYEPDRPTLDPVTANSEAAAGAELEVVRSLYEDRQGHLWIGTFQGGISEMRVRRDPFHYFTHDPGDPDSLSDASIACALQDHTGQVWVGTEQGVINRFDPDSGKSTGYAWPSTEGTSPAILSLLEDDRHRLWAGSFEGGLARFDPQTGAFVIQPEAGQIWALAPGPDGTLWLGTNAGLDRYDPETRRVVQHFGERAGGNLGDLSVRSLLVDAHGVLWVGSFGGLASLPPGAKVLERYPQPAAETIVALGLDRQQQLWLGTVGRGLERFEPSTKTFTNFQSFPSDTIDALEGSADGKLWLGTNHGLIQFDPDSGKYTAFDLTNGLESLQFHLGGGGKLKDGRLVFGSLRGLYVIDPTRVQVDTSSPPVVITSVRVGDRVRPLTALSVGSGVQLDFGERLLAVDFAVLDYNFPRRNQYSYRLEGSSNQWVELGHDREVAFSDLAPGHYIFRVRANNSDGVWSDASEARLAIFVPPPVWSTWWFRLGIGGILVAVLFGWHRKRVKRLQRDLAAQQEAQQVLRTAEEKYRELVEEIAEVIFAADAKGTITYISPVVHTLLGVLPAELIGESLTRLLGEEGLASVMETGRSFSPASSAVCEHALTAKNGEQRWIRASTRPIYDGARMIGLRGVITDVTDVKRLETQVRQSQKMDAIGQLAGGIAHDFNNLLTAIITYTDLLLEANLPEEARHSGLKEIRNASQRATSLTRQLLAFSRQQQLQPQFVDLNVLLGEMQKMLQRLIGENIMLALILDRSPAVVRADPGQLQQIVLNLALNARDAMPQGGRLLIQTADVPSSGGPADMEGRKVMLLVSDTGTGMAPEVKARLFEPFFTTKGVGKGTGLGLSTVYGIVRQSGGRIEVATALGAGTTFRIYIPRAKGDAPVAPRAPAKKTPDSFGSLLVVEDNETVFNVLKRIFQNTRGDVQFAASAEEAIELCDRRAEPFDVLLTDVVMPGRDGVELGEELKRRFPAIRIIFMSGYADDVVRRHGSLAGGDGFLQKPFTQTELFEQLAAATSPGER
ncbi:MAG TPA: two-component regulator propeller domain-containing protein [Opitutaceae bacterium]